ISDSPTRKPRVTNGAARLVQLHFARASARKKSLYMAGRLKVIVFGLALSRLNGLSICEWQTMQSAVFGMFAAPPLLAFSQGGVAAFIGVRRAACPFSKCCWWLK